jgi:hypothetical protein
MYLACLRLNRSRRAVLWASNPYRVHQRLLIAYEGEPRLLFRIEDLNDGVQILVQSSLPPDWERAFADFPVLAEPPQYRSFEPRLSHGGSYRFRLLANPTVKKTVAGKDEPKKSPHRAAEGERPVGLAGAQVWGSRGAFIGVQYLYSRAAIQPQKPGS